MRIYIDTSAFYALLDRDDLHHRNAKKIWSKTLEDENVLFTSNYVLVESFALIQHRLGMEAVTEFYETLLPLINIEWVDENTHKSATNALLTASRRELSLVDCVSFEMMRNLGIETAFAFDPHFKELGFKFIS